MTRHHLAAIVLAGLVSALAVADTVVFAVTGNRTFITDDSSGNTATAVGMGLLLGASFAALAVVLVREAALFGTAGRVVRIARRALLTGLVLLSAGSLIWYPIQSLAGITEGPAYDVSGLAAMLALLLTFSSATVLGLSVLRRNPLGLGGLVLRFLPAVIVVTVLAAVVAPAWASPVGVTVVAVVAPGWASPVGVTVGGVGGGALIGVRPAVRPTADSTVGSTAPADRSQGGWRRSAGSLR